MYVRRVPFKVQYTNYKYTTLILDCLKQENDLVTNDLVSICVTNHIKVDKKETFHQYFTFYF